MVKTGAHAALRERQAANALRARTQPLSAATAAAARKTPGAGPPRADAAADGGAGGTAARAPFPLGALGAEPEQANSLRPGLARLLNALLCLSAMMHAEILDTVQQALDDTLASDKNFSVRLQTIKADFFHRRYNEVFDCPGNLPVYNPPGSARIRPSAQIMCSADLRSSFLAAQYVPARALAYYQLLLEEPAIFACICEDDCRVVALGGGAGSELVGFLAASTHVRAGCGRFSLNLTVLDRVDWTDVHARLLAAATSRWGLADGAALKAEFALADLLDLEGSAGAALKARLGDATLVTAMFVLNELMAVSRPKTMALVALLGKCLTRGTKLLVMLSCFLTPESASGTMVVDSAGSISNLQVNGNTYFLYM
ncbi:MAG: hypothetical protein BJ554DRAFT_5978, partial [Olpidium bornovanus]